MAIYRFYDENVNLNLILEIDEKDDSVIGALLDEYRYENQEYNTDEWIKFLKSKGYEVTAITPRYNFYF